MKRLFDIFVSSLGLIVASPILMVVIFIIWIQDFNSPFYIASRVGKNGRLFKMVKLRSMIVNADSTGVDSTASNDRRITSVGHFVRRFKLDEFTQLFNVLLGDMSLVGPRPNVKRETDLYTMVEKKLLSVKPGITDFSSIVFADEGNILMYQSDPDIAYHQLIRPGKSQLGLFYVNHSSLFVDITLLFVTLIGFISRKTSLCLLVFLLKQLNASNELCAIASRRQPLKPSPPPGATRIVTSRDGCTL